MNGARHLIELPRRILVGPNVISEVGGIAAELSLRGPVVIVTGPHVSRLYGSVVSDSLTDAGFRDVAVVEAKAPTVDEARRVAAEASEYKPGFIVGLGGGKAIDVAKYASRQLGVPYISVPTSASHDGIASPFASLRGAGKPYSVKTSAPIAIVADVDVIANAPPRLLRAGAGDLVAKLTAVRDWRLAHKLKGEYYGDYAASLALLSARHVLRFARLIARGGREAARVVVEGLISSGVAMCIAGSTRPASGSEHLFSHALDIVANYPALHGEQVAVGTIMMLYLHGGRWRRLRAALKLMGLPVTAKQLGVRDEDIIDALVLAHKIRPERYTILGETGLTREAAENLARRTGVID